MMTPPWDDGIVWKASPMVAGKMTTRSRPARKAGKTCSRINRRPETTRVMIAPTVAMAARPNVMSQGE